MALSKDEIISAYKGLVTANAGRRVGEKIFVRETGISRYFWQGGYWRSWSAFQTDAGYAPNLPNEKTPDEIVLDSFARLTLEQGRIPSEADLVLKRRSHGSFPNKLCFRRWGNHHALLKRVEEHCEKRPEFRPVLKLVRGEMSANLDRRIRSFAIKGFVYLIRSGKYSKLSRSNAAGRRLRELAIQLPDKPNTTHVLETDDPEGIERYWHTRFADRRVREGAEWFSLIPEDIRAFKRRRFQ